MQPPAWISVGHTCQNSKMAPAAALIVLFHRPDQDTCSKGTKHLSKLFKVFSCGSYDSQVLSIFFLGNKFSCAPVFDNGDSKMLTTLRDPDVLSAISTEFVVD